MSHVTPWSFTLPYVVSLGATVLLAILITSQKSNSATVRPFLVWVCAAGAYTLGYLFELRVPDLESKVFWDNAQWLPFPVLVWGIVTFAFRYAGRAARARRVGGLAAATMGGAALAVVWGATFGDLRESARIEYTGSVPALVYDFTGFDHVASATGFVWFTVGLISLWQTRRAQPEGQKLQTTLVLLGLSIPVSLGLLAFTPIRILGQRDVAPLAFSVGAVFVFWGIYRYHLFDFMPVARVAVLEAIRDPVLVVDPQERIMDANIAARAFAGGQDLVGKRLSEVFPSLSASNLDDDSARGHVVRTDERVMVVSLVPVPDDKGRRIARAIVLRDVTEVERLNAELEHRVEERTQELVRTAEHLRASEAKLRAVFNGTNTLIGLLDVEGKLVAANRTALTLAGVEEDAVLGRPFSEAPWWKHDPGERKKLEQALVLARAGMTQHFETTHPAKDGGVRTIDFRLTPYRDEAGDVAWMIPEGRDITELKESERQKALLSRRLEHGERLESLGRLAGGVAHDFNNLLMVITGNAELLVEELARHPNALGLVKDIQQAATSAGSLTRQLLAFSKERKQEDAVLEVDAQLTGLSELLRRLVGAGIALDVSRGATGAWARIAAGQFEQIVINLVVNAKQALKDRGKIRISTSVRRHDQAPLDAVGKLSAPGNYVVTSISDDGPGVDPAIQERVFEPFFTTKEGGTGLGLATVYALTTRAGGLICLRSAAGQGTTVEIHLPEVEAQATTKPEQVSRASRGGLRVLLVDDNSFVLGALGKALERFGCTVTTAAGPEQARRLLADAANPELLMTDISMPGMTGTELALEAVAVHPTLKVLFMSANPAGEDVQRWIAERGARFLQKPIPLDALRQTLGELC